MTNPFSADRNSFPVNDIDLSLHALNATSCGVVITDNHLPDNPIIFCNQAFLDISGYEKHEIIGRNCRFLQNDDRNQPAREILRQALLGKKSCVVELRNYRKDGSMFWNELHMSCVKDRQGEARYFIGVQNEITLRKSAELKLRQSQEAFKAELDRRTLSLRENEEFLGSIVETMREGLVVLDPSMKVQTVNSHFLTTFRVTAEETIGQDFFSLGNGQWDIPALRTLLKQILPTQNPVVDFEVQHNFPHIGNKNMTVNAHQIEFEGRFKDRILLAIEDVSERRIIEQRKDDFLSIASHELKSPLTVIKGYIQLLQNLLPQNSGDRLKVIVDKILAQLNKLNALVIALLDVSKINAGMIEMQYADFDFDGMIHDVIESQQNANPSHKLLLTGHTGRVCHGDKDRIEQVLTNLITNAIKYSPGSNEVDINLSVVSNFLKVTVADHGLGIALKDQKKIFEKFYRVGNVQKKFPGMGIGLYVCEQIIKTHGGNMWVESEEGKGALFCFTLPCNEENSEPK